jgi:hypothetical protein
MYVCMYVCMYGRFIAFPSRQLLAQMEARMTNFVTRTVPPPCADHSLRHSTTRVGLRARWVRILFFLKTSVLGDFRELLHTVFGTRANFLETSRIVTKYL